jgi:hypothetical protein
MWGIKFRPYLENESLYTVTLLIIIIKIGDNIKFMHHTGNNLVKWG